MNSNLACFSKIDLPLKRTIHYQWRVNLVNAVTISTLKAINLSLHKTVASYLKQRNGL